VALAALAGVISVGATLQALTVRGGLIVNTSSSVSVGFYRASPPPARLTRGALVLSCALPEILASGVRAGFVDAGLCPGGGAPLIKYAVGVGGDSISEDASGVRVDGQLLAHSRPLRTPDGRVHWKHLRMRLGADVIWLYGSHPLSWDSRYFGAVPAGSVRAQLAPLWIPSGTMAHLISVIWGPCPQGFAHC
jgi:conjugative transfer signal peptidase TraF